MNLRKQDADKDFFNVVMSKEDYDAYMEWSLMFQQVFKTRFHKGYLAQLFREGYNSISELKTINNQHTHTKKNMHIGILHRKAIDVLNSRWALDKLEDETNFKILHNDLILVIKDIFKLKDRRPINERRDEILKLLNLKKIQEGKDFFVVHQYYEEKEKPKKIKDLQIEEIEKKIKSVINRIIEKHEDGLEDSVIFKQYGLDLEKNKELITLKFKENGIIKDGTKYILKEIIEEKKKLTAMAEADAFFGQ